MLSVWAGYRWALGEAMGAVLSASVLSTAPTPCPLVGRKGRYKSIQMRLDMFRFVQMSIQIAFKRIQMHSNAEICIMVRTVPTPSGRPFRI